MLRFEEDKRPELELVVGRYYTNRNGIKYLFQLVYDECKYYFIKSDTGTSAGTKHCSLEKLKKHSRDDLIPFYGTITISKD